MAESNMPITKDELVGQLMTIVQDLPPEQIAQLSDYADYLRTRYAGVYPERGTAEAILYALEHVGPLIFEPGELDTLLAEIDQMRNLDLEEHG